MIYYRQGLSLRARLNVAIILSVLVIISLGLIFSVLSAQAKVHTTVSSSIDMAILSIKDGVRHSDYKQARFWQSQLGLSAGTQNLRVQITLPSGQVIKYLGNWDMTMGARGPGWFERMIEPQVISRNTLIKTDIGTIRAIIHSDPRGVLERAWIRTRALFGLIILQACLVALLVHMIVKQALTSVAKILSGLELLKKGDFKKRLPSMNVPEFTRISDAINHTAAALQKISSENRSLVSQSLNVQEEERQALARELHDELGQSLIAIKMTASAIPSHDAQAREALSSIVSICDHVYSVVKTMMKRLRPTMLDDFGLAVSLRHMVDTWLQQNQDIDLQFYCAQEVDSCSSAIRIHLYRIVQEALNNIAKYAQASVVIIKLDMQCLSNSGITADSLGYLSVYIEDNGQGFDQEEIALGFGVLGMRERVEILGGEFELQARKNEGVRISILIPCQADNQHERQVTQL